ncbi:hypothetical protein GQ55_8G051700 [Panicum hallii var. hallii]|uniref:Peptidase A1 domain-containing protein n=1 Tax=Panicum hallii var. hallii TaxID=1504633 RepID=A0A2T7CKW7_9POAL|nr:hypothetical protein GQ55_8G051700 [Panicum hallii var. hallii]
MAARWTLVAGLLLLLPLLPSASSSMVFKLDGNVYPAGHFYVTMNIADPSKPYFLSVDTGSDLTWLECAASNGACERCNKVPHPHYQPGPPSYKVVPCTDPLCDTLHQDLGTTKHCAEPFQCDYTLTYADGSSIGVLMTDKFSLPMAKASNDHPDLAIGCGYDQGKNAGKIMTVDGTLGLGPSSVSLVSQLKNQKIITKNVIGHCLSTKGGGYLFFGEENVPASDVTWVPMAPRTPGKPYPYSAGHATLQLDTMSIGAEPMEVVLDSGSAYTYLPELLHSQLVTALKASLSKSSVEEVHDPALPLCWKGNGPFKSLDDLNKEFKSLISLNFGNGVTMTILPENYLITTEQGSACLGILGTADIGTYLIGAITMQDHLVIYDNEIGRLGWAPSLCDRMPQEV